MGKPKQALADVVRESGAEAVFAEEDYSPYARRRDEIVAASLPLRLVRGVTVFHPDEIKKGDGGSYTVFTPFSRAWRARPLPSSQALHGSPAKLGPVPPLGTCTLPDLPVPAGFPPGEEEAQRRLGAFLKGPVFEYRRRRDLPAEDGTSILSPYLRFGMISPRLAAVTAASIRENAAPDDAARDGVDCWINELIWREFYLSVLYHFPSVLKHSFNQAFRSVPWRKDKAQLSAWQQGRTGYPIVDAGMRQLQETGWMHNRLRMIAASFLVKDLLIDWREGERWFMRRLIDGDPASNNGGWQWTAGVGTDAAPYFRIFNPILQSRKFDPQGIFIRRWVPELANVPGKFVHEPWTMTGDLQQRSGCILGKDYPLPLVDHALARDRTLAAFKYR